MPNDNNALVLSDNENGTQSATWTPVEEITPDQKVLIGQLDPVSGTMQAAWNPSSDAAVFKTKTVTENGVYDAQQDDADGYSVVTVDVANSYEASDEGKVVSAGALVAQTSTTITSNGTVDTTTNNSVTVNVAGATFANSPEAFTLLTNIRGLTVDVPSGATSIGSNAFNGCTGLTAITLPATVTSLASNAFYGCTGLTEVELPSGVTSIGGNAFNGCTGLESVNIPDGVTSLASNTFSGCTGLTSMSIPSSVTSIASTAFSGCTNLTAITVDKAEGSITGAPWGATNATVTWAGE